MKIKTLFLVRHAHREPESEKGIRPVSLSAKGIHQSELIAEYFESHIYQKKTALLSSPRKRCIETLSPLSKKSKIQIEILDELDEGGDLDAKIKAFKKTIQSSPHEVIIACTHGDWIPYFISKTFEGKSLEPKKASITQILLDESGQFEFGEYIPTLTL
jgi:broad specificity phosphatase PhoE